MLRFFPFIHPDATGRDTAQNFDRSAGSWFGRHSSPGLVTEGVPGPSVFFISMHIFKVILDVKSQC